LLREPVLLFREEPSRLDDFLRDCARRRIKVDCPHDGDRERDYVWRCEPLAIRGATTPFRELPVAHLALGVRHRDAAEARPPDGIS
jgi:hypothetical protein